MRISIIFASWIVAVAFAAANSPQNVAENARDANQRGDCLQDFEEDKILNCDDNCTDVYNPLQADSDQDGFGNACDADISVPNDCITNFLDYNVLIAAFLSTPSSSNWNPDADFNGDGIVNFVDINIFKTFFLNEPGPSGQASC